LPSTIGNVNKLISSIRSLASNVWIRLLTGQRRKLLEMLWNTSPHRPLIALKIDPYSSDNSCKLRSGTAIDPGRPVGANRPPFLRRRF
jgi:hypothetical protein